IVPPIGATIAQTLSRGSSVDTLIERPGRRPQRHPDRFEVSGVVIAVSEQFMKIRRSLEEKFGVEEASYLMDRPVGGGSELVTNHTLDLKFDHFEARTDAKIDALSAGFDLRFVTLEGRLGAVDARFDAIDKRIDGLDRRLEVIDQRLAGLPWKLITAVTAAMTLMTAIFVGFLAAFGR